MFDHTGCLKRYSGAVEILKEFFDVRLDLYRKRKEYLEGQLTAEAAKLTNQARFIVEKIEGKVVVGELRSGVLYTRVHAHACMGHTQCWSYNVWSACYTVKPVTLGRRTVCMAVLIYM